MIFLSSFINILKKSTPKFEQHPKSWTHKKECVTMERGVVFMPQVKRKQYSGEFKQKVVEDLRANKLSLGEAAIKHGVRSKTQVMNWERIYLEQGAEGLYIERRGKALSTSGVRKGRPPKFNKKQGEDLIGELQRLRAEVEYLKKLNALVSERVQREKKQKSSGN